MYGSLLEDPLLRLPLELNAHIFSFLRTDLPDAERAALCLVCKRWLPLAVDALYRCPSVSNAHFSPSTRKDTSFAKLLRTLEGPDVRLRERVHSLTVRDPQDVSLFEFLRANPMPNLKALSFLAFRPESTFIRETLPLSCAVQSTFVQLQVSTLHLTSNLISPALLSQLLFHPANNKVEALHTTGDHLLSLSPPPHSLSHLRVLHIHEPHTTLNDFLRAATQLHTLHVGFMHSDVSLLGDELLRWTSHARHALRRISFVPLCAPMRLSELEFWRRLPSIQEAQFDVRAMSQEGLEHLPPSLRVLSLVSRPSHAKHDESSGSSTAAGGFQSEEMVRLLEACPNLHVQFSRQKWPALERRLRESDKWRSVSASEAGEAPGRTYCDQLALFHDYLDLPECVRVTPHSYIL